MARRVVRVDAAAAVALAKTAVEAHNRVPDQPAPVEVLDDLEVLDLWWAWIVRTSGAFGLGPLLIDKFTGEVIWTGSRFLPHLRRIERERGYRAWWRFWGPTIEWRRPLPRAVTR